MKWQGRQGSGNIEDRRGMSKGRMAIGGGIGTIVVAIIVLLLGGDPSQLLNNTVSEPETEQVTTTAEEDQMAQFVSVVLKGHRDSLGLKYLSSRTPLIVSLNLFCSEVKLNPPVVLRVRPVDLFIAHQTRKYISI